MLNKPLDFECILRLGYEKEWEVSRRLCESAVTAQDVESRFKEACIIN